MNWKRRVHGCGEIGGISSGELLYSRMVIVNNVSYISK
jgi:hypothetical protein